MREKYELKFGEGEKNMLSSYFIHSTVFHPNSLFWGILPRKWLKVLAPVHFAYILGTLYKA